MNEQSIPSDGKYLPGRITNKEERTSKRTELKTLEPHS